MQTSQQPPQTVTSPPPSAKKSSYAKWAVLGILVIILIVVAVFAFSGGAGVGSPLTVSVSGFVSTGFGTHPTNVQFTSDNGALYYGTVNVTNQDSESYSAQLPNGHVYSVLVLWSGALGSSGSCNAGTLSVSQSAGSGNLLQNFNC